MNELALASEARCIEIAVRGRRVLRRIRSSILYQHSHPLTTIDPQEGLLDAEATGSAVSRYLIDPLPGYPSDNEYEEATSIIKAWEDKYGKYTPYSLTQAKEPDTLISTIPSVVDLFRLLAEVPVIEGWQWKTLKMSANVRALPNLNIHNNRLGILAPLSTDFLQTAFLQRFIQKHTAKPPFHLRAISLGLDREGYQQLAASDRFVSFAKDVDEIAVFTDLDSNGTTRTLATQAAITLFPGKQVHGADCLR